MNNKTIRRKYKKPAIQEAIFEVKFDYAGFDSAIPGQFFEKVRQLYPKKQDIKHISVFLGASHNTPPIQAPSIQACKEDGTELLQVGPGIVVANCLRYTSWENFSETIYAAINAYIDLAKPSNVTRVATRYINSFLIPEEKINLSDYFCLGFQIPSSLSNLKGLDLTLLNEIETDKNQCDQNFEIRTKFMTDALKPGEIGNRFILDIDCYTTTEISPVQNKILSLATQAHNILSSVFETIITEKLRYLMEVE